MRNAEFILNNLKQLKQDVLAKQIRPQCGICKAYRVYDSAGGLRYKLLNLDIDWSMWPKFSGSDNYPVPLNGHFPHLIFGDIALSRRSMWEGEYGNNRMELLDWLIEQLESKIKE